MKYTGLKDRPEKEKVQEDLFKVFKKEHKVCLMLPSTTLKDLKRGFDNNIFNSDSKFIFVENGNCDSVYVTEEGEKKYWEIPEIGVKNSYKINFFIYNLVKYSFENTNFNIDNCVFHFDDIENLDLEESLKQLNEKFVDFAYFDLCGIPNQNILNWYCLNKHCFTRDSDIGFTYCINGLQRLKKGNEYSYYFMDKPEEDISFSNDNLMEKINTFHQELFGREVIESIVYKDIKQNMYSFMLGKVKRRRYNIKNLNIEKDIIYNRGQRWAYLNLKCLHLSSQDLKFFLERIGKYDENIFNKHLSVINRFENSIDLEKFRKGKKSFRFSEKFFYQDRVRNRKVKELKELSEEEINEVLNKLPLVPKDILFNYLIKHFEFKK